MKKVLRTSDKILTALALLGDIAIEVYSRGHGFGWKRSFAEALSVRNSTFRCEVNRFLKTGDIEKVVDRKGRVCLKLTSPGRSKFERLFPLAKLASKKWDGNWRVVIFDIEEKEKTLRNSLRRKLLSLGFGKLQESVYVTPLDVLVDLKEFLRNEKLYGRVLVFEARELLGSDPKIVANFIWRLEELNKKYEELIGEAEAFDKGGSGGGKEKFKEKLFQLLLTDPVLPREFLPEDWAGEKARGLITKL